MTKKKWNGCTLTVFFFFFFLSNLHHHVKQAVLRSEPVGFPDKTEDKRRARVENGKCHSAIRCKLKGHSLLAVAGETWVLWERNPLIWLVGPEALCSVAGGGQHDGAPRVSTEVLKMPIKGWSFWVARGAEHEFTGSFTNLTPTHLFCFMNQTGRTWKNIYIFYQTLPLTLKVNDSINIQLQNVNVQTDIQTKTLIRVTKFFICKCLRHSLFLVFKNLLVFFFFF